MANLIPNRFSQWHLTPEENVAGCILTDTNTKVIQNLVAEKATQKNNLVLDPEHPQLFIQQESYLTGQIEILEFLLQQSEAVLTPQNQSEI